MRDPIVSNAGFRRDRYSVWAPDATTVDLVMANAEDTTEDTTEDSGDHGGDRPVGLDRTAGLDRFAMAGGPGGWWYAEQVMPHPGALYAFSVDGGPPRPDPRSRHQPDGVHGLSRWVDDSCYRQAVISAGFCPPSLETGVVYELHVGTFSVQGTLDGAIARLDYLAELGVTHVELLPVAAASGNRGWGYDGVAIYAVWEAYGGPDALVRFVDACHARGLAVILDVVYNHLGPEGNYLAEFGPYFTDAYKTPWGSAVNLDGDHSDQPRRFIIENALMWMRDYRIDGLRIDAVHALHDESAFHILEELAGETHRLSLEVGRPLVLIAESDLNDPRLVAPRERGGYGLDAQWSDDFHHALHVALTGETHGYYAGYNGIDHLARSLREVFVHAGDYSPARHRRHGRSVGNLPGSRFLAYSQNHDQVGNRAVGERLCHLVSPARSRIAAALTILSPFVPMLFQGEEWAASAPFQYFTSHGDAELGQAVREGRRHEFRSFGWRPQDVPDPQASETFRRSVLDWDERLDGRHAQMLEWYRSLLALRHNEPDLKHCDRTAVSVQCDPEAGWLHLRRGRIDVVAVFSDNGAAVQGFGAAAAAPGCELLLASDETVRLDGRALRFGHPGVAVLRRG